MAFDVAKIEEKINAVVTADTVIDARIGGVQLDTLEKAMEVAKVMAIARGMVPVHCQGEPGVCMAIIMRALTWRFDPFAVAAQTYVAKDGQPVAYMAQIIHAVINTHAGLKGRLAYEYTGEGQERRIKVIGTFKDGDVREYLSPMIKDIKVKNSPLWVADPDQQLGYYGVRAWGRRWTPEALLGVYTKDEIDEGALSNYARDVTPKEVPRLTGKPAKTNRRSTKKGFDHDKAAKQADQVAGKPEPDAKSASPGEQLELGATQVAKDAQTSPAVS